MSERGVDLMDQKKEQRLYQLEEDIRLAEYNQAILLEELEDIRHKKLSGLIEINEQWNKLGQLFADDPMYSDYYCASKHQIDRIVIQYIDEIEWQQRQVMSQLNDAEERLLYRKRRYLNELGDK